MPPETGAEGGGGGGDGDGGGSGRLPAIFAESVGVITVVREAATVEMEGVVEEEAKAAVAEEDAAEEEAAEEATAG